MTLWATAWRTNRGLWREPGFGYETLGRVMAGRTTGYWLAFCAEHGIPAAPAAGLDEIIEALPDAEHPAGTYKHIPSPARFSATPATLRRPAPLPGQHNHEILTEAGLTEEEIAALRTTGWSAASKILTPSPEPCAGRWR